MAPLSADVAETRRLLGAATFIEVRVAADDAARRERIRSRRDGRGPVLAGDSVYAASDAMIEAITSDSAARSSTSLRPDEYLLDTSRLSATAAAARLSDGALSLRSARASEARRDGARDETRE